MSHADLLLLLVGFAVGLTVMSMVCAVAAFVVSKRSDDEAERLFLELQDNHRGFLYTQRHTSEWQ